MSKKENIQCDKMMETRLKENSEKLNISIDELIDRYIRRGVYSDYFYWKRPKLSLDELKEMSKRDAERDRKNGIFPKLHDNSHVGICNRQDD